MVKNFSYSRVKATQMLNGATMPDLKTYLVNQMKEEPYSLNNNGTSDAGLKKMNAAYTIISDVNYSEEIQFKFYHSDALRNWVSFVQFGKCEKHPVALLHGCFSRFSNCTNDTKSRNRSQYSHGFHGILQQEKIIRQQKL